MDRGRRQGEQVPLHDYRLGAVWTDVGQKPLCLLYHFGSLLLKFFMASIIAHFSEKNKTAKPPSTGRGQTA